MDGTAGSSSDRAETDEKVVEQVVEMKTEKTEKTEKKAEKKAEKSYFASAVDSINPWNTTRSTTPTLKENPPPKPAPPTSAPTKKADDHTVNTLYGQSFRRYPPDCPPLNIMWFHAVDVSSR